MLPPSLPDRLRRALAAAEELSVRELADAFGMHRNTIYRFVRAGLLKGRGHGIGRNKRRRMFSRREIEALWRKLNDGRQ